MAEDVKVRVGMDTRGVETGAKRVKGTFDRMKSSAARLGAIFATVFAAKRFIQFSAGLFRAAASFDAMKRGLAAVIPAGENVEEILGRIRDLAKEPGLGFREALEGVTRLRAVGLAAEDAENIIREFGNSVALVGGGKAELLQAVDAISKMGAEGKITEERLNQLSLNMPTLRRVMQDTFGTATANGIRALGLTVEEFTNQLVGGLSKQNRASGGAQNAIENLNDSIDQLKVTLGETFGPATTTLITALTKEMEKFTEEADRAGIAAGLVALGELERPGPDFSKPISTVEVERERRARRERISSGIAEGVLDSFDLGGLDTPGRRGVLDLPPKTPAEPDPFSVVDPIAAFQRFKDVLSGKIPAEGSAFQAGEASSLARVGGGGGVAENGVLRRMDTQTEQLKKIAENTENLGGETGELILRP